MEKLENVLKRINKITELDELKHGCKILHLIALLSTSLMLKKYHYLLFILKTSKLDIGYEKLPVIIK